MDDISIIVSEKTLQRLDEYLVTYHNNIILRIEQHKKLSLDDFKNINNKKKKNTRAEKGSCQYRIERRDIDHDLCLARVWNNGFGGQCCRPKKCGDYCKNHYLQEKRNMKLPHGRIDMPCPKILKGLSIQPFSTSKKIVIKKKLIFSTENK